MTASSFISIFVLAIAGYAIATADPPRSKSFPSDLKDLTDYSKVREQTELTSAILEMANEFGKVENYKSSEYIWDKVQSNKRDSTRAKVESAFFDAMKHYVDEKLPEQLKKDIFGDNAPSSFKIRTLATEAQQSDKTPKSHLSNALSAMKKSIKSGDKPQVPAVKENPEKILKILKIRKSARKLSFFFMEQLNLFAVLESYKIIDELVGWMTARCNIYKSFKDNPTWNTSGTEYKGQPLKAEEIVALVFINHVVYAVSEIGPRQQEYVFYMQNGRRFGSFKEEEFPQMHIISRELFDKEKDEFGTDLYSSKRFVENLFSEHTKDKRWEDSRGEVSKIETYLSSV
ncbi:hypothetical protein DdX_10083 [Ditylenchus destructor]|uniref:Uncharacterized protein n=1 Tax=Ditylenchus destructor TaxID=166010 RepID=A0AAD4N4V1_9BILA|nr:hypothetical protein DdX_10083 [Ditylenchus destructor]